MMKTSIKIIAVLVLMVFAFQAQAWPNNKEKEQENKALKMKQDKLAELRREVSALQSLRLEKAEILEKKEAARWGERYRQNLISKEQQEKARSLEARYSRRAGDLSRANEELLQSKSLTQEVKSRYEDSKQQLEGLVVQYRQAIEEDASKLSQDIPLNIEMRTLELAQAGELINLENPKISKVMSLYFTDKKDRLNMTMVQTLKNDNSIMGDKAETPVSRLVAGTVFAGEIERSGANSKVQMLLRTGALQGKTFDWRSDLSEDYTSWLREGINSALAGENIIDIPMDVLQNKALSQAAGVDDKLSIVQAIEKWFKTGGVVMYPLIFIALLALFMALHKYFELTKRGRVPKKFIVNIYDLVEKGKWEEARELCQAHTTSMSFVLSSILNYGGSDRNNAEKSLREAMLREYPFLERRLSIIGALGSSAPLLGLLGTVSGMITLFKIITQAGTNDARILAGGISEALVTTQTGLIIAVPIMLLHGYLVEKMEKIVSDDNAESMTLLNKIWPEDESIVAKKKNDSSAEDDTEGEA